MWYEELNKRIKRARLIYKIEVVTLKYTSRKIRLIESNCCMRYQNAKLTFCTIWFITLQNKQKVPVEFLSSLFLFQKRNLSDWYIKYIYLYEVQIFS